MYSCGKFTMPSHYLDRLLANRPSRHTLISRFNQSTKVLTTGTYMLSFTVAGDPVIHTVQFQVR